MKYLGFDTWDQVLALFQSGGALAGRWGWLATLRAAHIGDIIQFYSSYPEQAPGWVVGEVLTQGTLVEREGAAWIQVGEMLFHAFDAPAHWGAAFGVMRGVAAGSPYAPEYYGPYHASQIYYNTVWGGDPADLIADVTGVLLSMAEPLPYVGGMAQAAGETLDIAGLRKDRAAWEAAGKPGPFEEPLMWVGLAIDYAELLPSPLFGVATDPLSFALAVIRGPWDRRP